MELVVRLAWIALALVHVAPAAALVAPGARRRLYGVASTGDLDLLLAHRGALFLAVVVLAVMAAVDPGLRRSASVVVAISVLGFLVLYARAGLPAGALRRIALVDAVALVPLAIVLVAAWRAPASP